MRDVTPTAAPRTDSGSAIVQDLASRSFATRWHSNSGLRGLCGLPLDEKILLRLQSINDEVSLYLLIEVRLHFER
jgi:hypothetical protein